MKTIISLALLFSASFAQAAITFSAATPLTPELRKAITRHLNAHCNIQSFSVVESQTIMNNQADENGVETKFYNTIFAVLTAPNQVYARIDVRSANTEVLSARSPLCRW